jgi:hypothetical protein
MATQGPIPEENAYDRALYGLADLTTPSGMVLGAVIAKVVLDSGLVVASLHRWVDCPEGTGLTQGRPFRFCTACDEERWMDGTLARPATYDAECRGTR